MGRQALRGHLTMAIKWGIFQVSLFIGEVSDGYAQVCVLQDAPDSRQVDSCDSLWFLHGSTGWDAGADWEGSEVCRPEGQEGEASCQAEGGQGYHRVWSWVAPQEAVHGTRWYEVQLRSARYHEEAREVRCVSCGISFGSSTVARIRRGFDSGSSL